jgi:hypothetical protein
VEELSEAGIDVQQIPDLEPEARSMNAHLLPPPTFP